MADEPGPVRSLWRDRDFMLFWGGQAVSLTGSAVTRVALPLVAVLTLHASPVELGLLEACVWLPFLGLPLLAGAYVDRHRKRPVLLTANAVRVVLLGLVPLLWALDALSVPALCAIALASGAAEVFFQVGEIAYVPALVGRDRLMAAYSGIESARFGADLGGPGVAGVLVQVFGPPLAILADAVSYAVSTVTLGAIRRREPAPETTGERDLRGEIAEGLRFLWRLRLIRTVVVQLMLVNLAWQGFVVAFVLYAIREREIGPGWWGLVLAAGGATAIASALLAPRLADRLGYGPALVVLAVVTNAPMLLVPAAGGPLWIIIALWVLAMGLTGLGGGGFNVIAMTLRTRLTPDHLLGRVGASVRLVVFAGIPAGALGGGVLAGAAGNRPALWITAAGATASTALLAPLWRLRVLPDGPAPTPASEPTPAPEPAPLAAGPS